MLISAELARERIRSSLYADLATEMIQMSTAALATAEYNKDFQRSTEQWSGNYTFKHFDGAEFMTNIFGEIAPPAAGSIVAAKGNHYPGRPGEGVCKFCFNQNFFFDLNSFVNSMMPLRQRTCSSSSYQLKLLTSFEDSFITRLEVLMLYVKQMSVKRTHGARCVLRNMFTLN